MTQRFEDPIPVEERLTEEEVQSIVKRYGEGQAGGDPRARVADVAEALQVEPAVVTRLLRDIRTADSEKQLKERLESLEKENAELKRRADDSDYGYGDFYSSMHWSGRRRLRRRSRSFALAAAVAVVAGVALSSNSSKPAAPTIVIVAIVAVMVFALRSWRQCRLS